VADTDGVGDGDTLFNTMLADNNADGDPEEALLDGDRLADREGVLDCEAPPLADAE
jgi:hypothetical protein